MNHTRAAMAVVAGLSALAAAYLTAVLWMVRGIGDYMDPDRSSGPLDGWAVIIVGAGICIGLAWLALTFWRSAKPAR